MIEFIRGTIDRLQPTEAIIEASGLGYLIAISVNTYSQIQNLKEVKLLIHEVIREDTHDLYGFFDEAERTLFRLLIGVSGVGPNTARVILSSLTPQQLQMCITSGDHAKLKAVKGIGLKTAQRIIVDLKDKIAAAELAALAADQEALTPGALAHNENREEALAALIALGFQKQASRKALDKIFAADPTTTPVAAIKHAFTML
ncbi:MAG: Holliday junction branch migration protein RuvA [Muribaculaceae bacterium]|nr:Holliday junction branch migration protein RuvA [Muribaculaceae bacterium]